MTTSGFGSTTIEIGGGARTSSFGPSAWSSGAMSTGIVAAIAIPNLLNAIDRGKQKRTMADMRSIGTAMESYAIDNNRYPGPTDGWQGVGAIEESLEPLYIRILPARDGWENPFLIWSDGSSYKIVSPGKGGIVDGDYSGEVAGGATSNFTADIVFINGQFVQWPEGVQQ
jgi:general secretion pathway protein G